MRAALIVLGVVVVFMLAAGGVALHRRSALTPAVEVHTASMAVPAPQPPLPRVSRPAPPAMQALPEERQREAIFAAARARNVSLTAAQRKELERLRAQRAKREPGVTYLTGYDADDVELVVRDAEAKMLAAALLAQQGDPPPAPGDAAAALRYRERMQTYLTELAAK